jgi:hypothetical protein
MTSKPKPGVVVLHGLARRAGSMDKLVEHLNANGFDARAYGYPSTSLPIAKLARQLCSRVRQDFKRRRVCAVTHSLGGVILRHMRDDRIRWRRIVMLAPPNNGSAVADFAASGSLGGVASAAFSLIYGPAGGTLAGVTSKVDKPTAWPYPPAPFAVIAGTRRRSLKNPTSWFLSDRVFGDDVDNDGTVSVDETKLPGMAAFATVPETHTDIMNATSVHTLVLNFLLKGSF